MKLGRSSVHIILIILAASSSRLTRVAGLSKGYPYALNSGSCHPAPRPRISRPPLIASRVADSLARSGGCLKGLQRTSCPSPIRLVAPANAERVVQHSKRLSPGLAYMPMTWSLVQTEWYPSLSQ